MSAAEEAAEAERIARDAALSSLSGHYDRLRKGLKDRPVPRRLADDAKAKVLDVGKEALEIAAENKAVIAGTLGALALWFLRKPLVGKAGGLIERLQKLSQRNTASTDTEPQE